MDLLLSGETAEYESRVFIFENQVNEGNSFIRHSYNGIYDDYNNGDVRWCDMDQDGYLDIVISDGWSGYIDIYINEIKEYNDFYLDYELPILTNNYFDIGDFNNDGDQDIIVTGYNSTDVASYVRIYENRIEEEDTLIELTDVDITGIKDGVIKCGDFDNDGDLDFALTGNDETENITKIYKNMLDVSPGFVELTDENLTGLKNSYLSWIDLDNDEDLDISVLGSIDNDYYLNFYRNKSTIANTAPTAPTNLSSNIANNEIELSWNAATDGETPQDGLTYNIKVGSASGEINVVTPLSDEAGNRLIVGLGNSQSNTFALIRNIPYSTYYWSVQAIDNAFKGGAFSSEATFSVEPNANFELEDNSICLDDTLEVYFTGYCYDTANTVFTWSFDGGTIIEGEKNMPHEITWDTPGSKTLSLQISDGTNTSTLVTRTLTINDLPEITLEDEISECDGATITLAPGLLGNISDYDFIWSTDETTSSIDVVSSDSYLVTVTDQNNCTSIDSTIVIFKEPFDSASICVVTVDSGDNVIIWERDYDKGIASYNVYKETNQADEYEIIGSVPFTEELSLIVDEDATPETKSERYKISVVDTCGNESELSDYHQTMHLTINLGANDVFNLVWDNYEGFDFSSYTIFRGTSAEDLEVLDTIANNDNMTYTDDPDDGQEYFYQIAVILPDLCSPASRKKASAGPYAQSVSNMENKLKASETNTSNSILSKYISVYPNPASNHLIISSNRIDIDYAEITDMRGKVILSINSKYDNINLDGLLKGMYLLHVYTDKGLYIDKLIIAK
ncbi:FG-GAP-like repeat-containing protein [Bacteroidota bacterium]